MKLGRFDSDPQLVAARYLPAAGTSRSLYESWKAVRHPKPAGDVHSSTWRGIGIGLWAMAFTAFTSAYKEK